MTLEATLKNIAEDLSAIRLMLEAKASAPTVSPQGDPAPEHTQTVAPTVTDLSNNPVAESQANGPNGAPVLRAAVTPPEPAKVTKQQRKVAKPPTLGCGYHDSLTTYDEGYGVELTVEEGVTKAEVWEAITTTYAALETLKRGTEIGTLLGEYNAMTLDELSPEHYAVVHEKLNQLKESVG